jgi:hypothetical protein
MESVIVGRFLKSFQMKTISCNMAGRKKGMPFRKREVSKWASGQTQPYFPGHIEHMNGTVASVVSSYPVCCQKGL